MFDVDINVTSSPTIKFRDIANSLPIEIVSLLKLLKDPTEN